MKKALKQKVIFLETELSAAQKETKKLRKALTRQEEETTIQDKTRLSTEEQESKQRALALERALHASREALESAERRATWLAGELDKTKQWQAERAEKDLILIQKESEIKRLLATCKDLEGRLSVMKQDEHKIQQKVSFLEKQLYGLEEQKQNLEMQLKQERERHLGKKEIINQSIEKIMQNKEELTEDIDEKLHRTIRHLEVTEQYIKNNISIARQDANLAMQEVKQKSELGIREAQELVEITDLTLQDKEAQLKLTIQKVTEQKDLEIQKIIETRDLEIKRLEEQLENQKQIIQEEINSIEHSKYLLIQDSMVRVETLQSIVYDKTL